MQNKFRNIIALTYETSPISDLPDQISLRIEHYERRHILIGVVSSASASIISLVVAFIAVSSVVSTLNLVGFFGYTDASVIGDVFSSGALSDVFSLIVENIPGYMFAGFIVSIAFFIGSLISTVGFARARLALD